MAISGTTALVGARGNDDAGDWSGSAYLFDFSDPCSIIETKLTASDAAAVDEFGCSVALSGATALVGAWLDDADSESGSAYLYDFSDPCSIIETKLTASDAAAMDRFGISVAISGSTALVGAPGNDGSGSAYLFGPPLFVDADASGSNDGSSWTNAYKYLQDALAVAVANDQIWVAEGTYKPDANSTNPGGTGSRTATFQLISSVTIKGGYAGFGEPDPSARDIELYETILSGDLNGNDVQVDPCDLLDEPTRAENSYHVVTGSGTEPNAVLDGFTITTGNANGSNPDNLGGGMYNDSGSPTVTNCTFTGNSAGWGGGGMYNDESNPTVTNCTFSGSSAIGGGGMFNWENSSPTVTNCTFTGSSAIAGGGMYNWENSSPTVTNCTFTGNSAGGGGGMFNSSLSSPTLTNCTFSGNSASGGGGGMYNDSGSPTVTNCTFSGNSAGFGGGMDNEFANPTVTNCTFSGNSASNWGGGMYNDESNPTLTNCILWGNSAPTGPEIFNDDSWPTVTYSDIAGGYAGTGNIDADPLFVDADGPDNIVGTEDDNLRLSPGSPCIDAGDNTTVPSGVTTDLDGLRFVDGDCNDTATVDMGPYEFAFVYFGDLDGDCDVDFGDFAIFGNNWLAGV